MVRWRWCRLRIRNARLLDDVPPMVRLVVNDHALGHRYGPSARASAKLLRRMAAADNTAHSRPLAAHTFARSAKCVRAPIKAPPTDGPATLTTPHNPTNRPR